MKIETKEDALKELFIDHRTVRSTETGVRRITKCMLILGIAENQIPVLFNHFEISGEWKNPIIQSEIEKFNKKK